jgi:small subunit ribosomal protein S7
MRKKKNHKRNIIADSKYQSQDLAKFINNLMYAGNKATVEKFTYIAIKKVSEKVGIDDIPLLFTKIISNIMVTHELRSRRVGGATYQVPKLLADYRSLAKTLKLLVDVIRKIKGKSLDEAITTVFFDAYNKTGQVSDKYRKLNTDIESNRVNAVYKW